MRRKKHGHAPTESLRALGVALARSGLAASILAEADAIGVPSAGRARIVSQGGASETSREEAAWRAASARARIVLDLLERSCRVAGRTRREVVRSEVIVKLLRLLMESAPRPLPPAEVFATVWGPPERHEGWANLVWVTVGRLRKLVGAGDSAIAWLDDGYVLTRGTAFLLVTE